PAVSALPRASAIGLHLVECALDRKRPQLQLFAQHSELILQRLIPAGRGRDGDDVAMLCGCERASDDEAVDGSATTDDLCLVADVPQSRLELVAGIAGGEPSHDVGDLTAIALSLHRVLELGVVDTALAVLG